MPESIAPLYGKAWFLKFYGKELRAWRERAGLSQQALGQLTITSRQLITAIEAGERVPSEEFTQQVDQLLDTSGSLGRIYEALCMQDGLSDNAYATWLAMCHTAKQVRTYSFRSMPGHLQCPEYQAYFKNAPLARPAPARGSDFEIMIERWRSLPQTLIRDNPCLGWFVLDESLILRWPDEAVRRFQVEYLVNLAKLPNVRLLLIPIDQFPSHVSQGYQSIVSFEDSPDVVYLEGTGFTTLLTDPSRVALQRDYFELAMSEALSRNATISRLESHLGRS